MPLFNVEGTLPTSKFYISPDYDTSLFRKIALGALGYNSNGSQNVFGKITSWLPGYNVLSNLAAQNVASGDTKQNIGDDLDNRLAKNQIGLGAIKTALMASSGLSSLAGDNTKTVTLADGSKMDIKNIGNDTSQYVTLADGSKMKLKGDNSSASLLDRSVESMNDIKSFAKNLSPDIFGGISSLLQAGTSPNFTNDYKTANIIY